MVYLFLCLILGFFFFILLLVTGSFFTVPQQVVAVVERFGKYQYLSGPGLHTKMPFIDRVAGKVSLRVQQLDVKAETKTKDNVFVHIVTSVQYHVMPDGVYNAFYKLNDPHTQINSYVFDVVRARVPRITIDELFEKKDEIAMAVKSELNETMNQFGFEIVNALVTDIEPDSKVKAAMNEINAAQRMRVAANERGEAEKILVVKAAEAEAEAKALQGEGIARQRKAIVEGLSASVEEFQSSVEGSTPADVMNLVLLTQYFDTMKDIGEKGNSSVILMPHGPGAVGDLASQLRNAVISADRVNDAMRANPAAKPEAPTV